MARIPREWLVHLTGDTEVTCRADDVFRAAWESGSPVGGALPPSGIASWELDISGGGRFHAGRDGVSFSLSASATGSGSIVLCTPEAAGRHLKRMKLEDPPDAGAVAVSVSLSGGLEARAKTSAFLDFDFSASRQAEIAAAGWLPPETSFPEALRLVFSQVRHPRAVAPGAVPSAGVAIGLFAESRVACSAGVAFPIAVTRSFPVPFLPEALLRASVTGGLKITAEAGFVSEVGILIRAVPGLSGDVIRVAINRGRARKRALGVRAGVSLSTSRTGDWPSVVDLLSHMTGFDLESVLAALRRVGADTGPAGGDTPASRLAEALSEAVIAPLAARWGDRLVPGEVAMRVSGALDAFFGLGDELRGWVLRHAGELDLVRGTLVAAGDAPCAAMLGIDILRAWRGEGIPVDDFLDRPEAWDPVRKAVALLLTPEKWPTFEAVLGMAAGRFNFRDLLVSLSKLRSPDEVFKLAAAPARALLAAVLGEVAERAGGGAVDRAIGSIRSFLDRVDSIEAGYREAMDALLKHRWRAEAGLAWSRVREDDDLLEADFNLSDHGAAEAYGRVVEGDLTGLGDLGREGGVEVRKAVLARLLNRALKVHFTLGPWTWESLESLVVRSSLRIAPKGELWVHTLSVSAEGRRETRSPGGEAATDEFRVLSSARLTSPDIQDDPLYPEYQFRCEYRLTTEDPVARPEELAALLEGPAGWGLLGGASPMEAALGVTGTRPPFPEVSLDYAVGIPWACFEGFLKGDVPPSAVEDPVVEILRACWLRGGVPGSRKRVWGGALTAENHALFRRRGRLVGAAVLAVVGPAQGMRRTYTTTLGADDIRVVDSAFRLARELSAIFEEFRGGASSRGAIRCVDLERFAGKLAGMHHRLARWGAQVDVLPHVLARMARGGSPPAARPSVALVAEARLRDGTVQRHLFTPDNGVSTPPAL